MSLSFSEAKLEQAIIELLQDQGYQHLIGDNVPRSSLDQVIIEDDLKSLFGARYQPDGITEEEIPATDQTVHHASGLRIFIKQQNILSLAGKWFSVQTRRSASKKISILNCSTPGIYLPPRMLPDAEMSRCNRRRNSAFLYESAA